MAKNSTLNSMVYEVGSRRAWVIGGTDVYETNRDVFFAVSVEDNTGYSRKTAKTTIHRREMVKFLTENPDLFIVIYRPRQNRWNAYLICAQKNATHMFSFAQNLIVKL